VHYRKIEIELIVAEDEAEPVVSQLNAALDGLEAKYEIFGGGIETVAVEHKGTRRRTALKHTIDAGQTAVAAVRMAGGKVADAFRAVIWSSIKRRVQIPVLLAPVPAKANPLDAGFGPWRGAKKWANINRSALGIFRVTSRSLKATIVRAYRLSCIPHSGCDEAGSPNTEHASPDDLTNVRNWLGGLNYPKFSSGSLNAP
jgi:hypothetical protein